LFFNVLHKSRLSPDYEGLTLVGSNFVVFNKIMVYCFPEDGITC